MKHKHDLELLLEGFFATTWARVWFVFVYLWLSCSPVLKAACFLVSLISDSILHRRLCQPFQMSLIKRILLHILSYVIAVLLAVYLLSGSVDLRIRLSPLTLFPG